MDIFILLIFEQNGSYDDKTGILNTSSVTLIMNDLHLW